MCSRIQIWLILGTSHERQTNSTWHCMVLICTTPNVNISEFAKNAAVAQLLSLTAYSKSPLSILYRFGLQTLYFVNLMFIGPCIIVTVEE